jgi:hypothetical protein
MMSQSQSHYQVHISQESTVASTKLGEVAISASWKQTSNQSRKVRGICIPMECVKAPEVPESFRALVEAVLMSQATEVLKAWVNDGNEEVFEVKQELFERPNLVQSYLDAGTNWMSASELEICFTASATWKRISGREEFKTNKTYQATASKFKDKILKLSGKATKFDPVQCDKLLVTLAEEDLQTPFGEFVATRLASIKKLEQEELDLSCL